MEKPKSGIQDANLWDMMKHTRAPHLYLAISSQLNVQ